MSIIARDRVVVIDYTNYRGERAVRRVLPTGVLMFTSNEWHPEPQWLMEAIDVDQNNKTRLFAIKDIHSWTPITDL